MNANSLMTKIVQAIILGYALISAIGNAETQSERGYSLLLGIYPASASTQVDDEQSILEENKTGYFVNGGAMLSAVSENLVLDLGVGWFRSVLSGKDPAAPIELEQPDGDKHKVTEVGTQTASAEVSARLRLGLFHIGPQVLVLFGEDTSYAPRQNEPEAHVLVGGQFGILTRLEDWDFRLSLRYDTDITIEERNLHLFGIHLAVGLPIWQQETKVIVKKKIKYRDRIKYRKQVLYRDRIQKIPVYKFVMSSDLVNFETDRAELTQPSKEFLADIGRFLSQNHHLWESIKVEGHADLRGSDAYNRDLAYRRAQSTASYLSDSGIAQDRMKIISFGENQPLDLRLSSTALARNRRVELHFHNVKDAKTLHRGLERIRRIHRRPSTCNGDSCL